MSSAVVDSKALEEIVDNASLVDTFGSNVRKTSKETPEFLEASSIEEQMNAAIAKIEAHADAIWDISPETPNYKALVSMAICQNVEAVLTSPNLDENAFTIISLNDEEARDAIISTIVRCPYDSSKEAIALSLPLEVVNSEEFEEFMATQAENDSVFATALISRDDASCINSELYEIAAKAADGREYYSGDYEDMDIGAKSRSPIRLSPDCFGLSGR